MKTELFKNAINLRRRVRFLYGLKDIEIEPYYVTTRSDGKKVVFGKLKYSNEIRAFDYNKIANLKILDYARFSPIIPILPYFN